LQDGSYNGHLLCRWSQLNVEIAIGTFICGVQLSPLQNVCLVKILDWEPEGTRRRGRPKGRWIDGVRRSMANHVLTEEDTRDRDRWRNLVLGEGKPL
jgi:hypothetical protein